MVAAILVSHTSDRDLGFSSSDRYPGFHFYGTPETAPARATFAQSVQPEVARHGMDFPAFHTLVDVCHLSDR